LTPSPQWQQLKFNRAEIDERLFGTPELAEQAFKLSVALLEALLAEIVDAFPDEEVSRISPTRPIADDDVATERRDQTHGTPYSTYSHCVCPAQKLDWGGSCSYSGDNAVDRQCARWGEGTRANRILD
jgi:hypothetical protein